MKTRIGERYTPRRKPGTIRGSRRHLGKILPESETVNVAPNTFSLDFWPPEL